MPVYFIRAGEDGPVKIGKADCVDTRLATLQCGHYQDLILLRTLPGGIEEEKWAHEAFRINHIRGEWFKFDPAMLTLEMPSTLANGRSGEEKHGLALWFSVGPTISIADFAQAIGRNPSTVWRWVKGHRMPDPDSLRAIEQATNGEVTANDMLRGLKAPAAAQ